MVDTWSITDERTIESIEAQIRGLNRRLYDLEHALQSASEILRDDPNNFAFKLTSSSLISMQGALQNELAEATRYRINEGINISLSGQLVEDHSASILSLSVILNRIQRLYSSIAQAITSGPTIRGPLSGAVVNATDLRLANIYPSSFGMTLYVPSEHNMFGSSISVEALESMFDLLAAVEDSDERIMRKAGEVGTRSMRHLKALSRHLDQTGTSISLGWKDLSGIYRSWEASPERSHSISEKIDKITQTDSEIINVSGRLVGASLLKDRFEISSADIIYEGRFVASLNESIRDLFGSGVEAKLEATEIRDVVSNTARRYFTLREIHAAQDE